MEEPSKPGLSLGIVPLSLPCSAQLRCPEFHLDVAAALNPWDRCGSIPLKFARGVPETEDLYQQVEVV